MKIYEVHGAYLNLPIISIVGITRFNDFLIRLVANIDVRNENLLSMSYRYIAPDELNPNAFKSLRAKAHRAISDETLEKEVRSIYKKVDGIHLIKRDEINTSNQDSHYEAYSSKGVYIGFITKRSDVWYVAHCDSRKHVRSFGQKRFANWRKALEELKSKEVRML